MSKRDFPESLCCDNKDDTEDGGCDVVVVAVGTQKDIAMNERHRGDTSDAQKNPKKLRNEQRQRQRQRCPNLPLEISIETETTRHKAKSSPKTEIEIKTESSNNNNNNNNNNDDNAVFRELLEWIERIGREDDNDNDNRSMKNTDSTKTIATTTANGTGTDTDTGVDPGLGSAMTDISNIYVAPSTQMGGGMGVFAKRHISPGETIATIPNRAVMSVEQSSSSSSIVGCAVAQTDFSPPTSLPSASSSSSLLSPVELSPSPTPEFILWLDMAYGRRHQDHFHHPYLKSLPDQAPDALSWLPLYLDSVSTSTSAPTHVHMDDQKEKEKERERRQWLQELEGTNLGSAILQEQNEFKNQYQHWMSNHLQVQHPNIFKDISLTDVQWARGMYYSRRYPSSLLQKTMHEHEHGQGKEKEKEKGQGQGQERRQFQLTSQPQTTQASSSLLGIMLPLFDLFNHRPNQPITWRSHPRHISFELPQKSATSSTTTGIPIHQEILNNYGPKGNEILLMMYGFCIPDNLYDSYSLQVVVVGGEEEKKTDGRNNGNDKSIGVGEGATKNVDTSRSTANSLHKRSLGTFQIHRKDSIFPQFPVELWKALNSMFEEEEEEEEDKSDQESIISLPPSSPTPVEIGIEAVELLLVTLGQRLSAFLSTQTRDEQRDTPVRVYRNGQRIILEEAIETLTEFLQPLENDSDDQMKG